MPIRVQVPGHGVVEFPDGTPEQDMSTALASLGQPEAPKPAGAPSTAEILAQGPRGMGSPEGMLSAAKSVLGFAKAHPAEVGATAAGLAAAPFTGGMSLPAAAAAMGVAGGAGAAIGDTLAGKPVTAGDVLGQGALSAAGPIIGAGVGAAGEAIANRALPTVRAALKTPISVLRRQAGASMTGVDGQANRVAGIVLKNRWAKPQQAMDAVQEGERAVQAALANAPKDATLDIAGRIPRYIKKLELSAGSQARPGADVGAIRTATKDVMNGPLGQDVTEEVMVPSMIAGPNGKPTMMPQRQVVGRDLRTNVSPQEGLKVARATGRWDNRKQWGELKGAEQEVSKATERALRDSVKRAVPEVKPALQKQHEALTVLPALEAMAVRAGNRDVVGLPAYVAAAGGNNMAMRTLGAALAQSLRNGQLRAGFGMARLGPAVAGSAGAVETGVPLGIRALLAAFGDSDQQPPQ